MSKANVVACGIGAMLGALFGAGVIIAESGMEWVGLVMAVLALVGVFVIAWRIWYAP